MKFTLRNGIMKLKKITFFQIEFNYDKETNIDYFKEDSRFLLKDIFKF